MVRTPKPIGIYAIVNTITGDAYIGSTYRVGGIEERWNVHRKDLQTNTHYNSFLQRSYNKHGKQAFSFIVLEHIERIDDIAKLRKMTLDREKFWIEKLQPRFNAQIVEGGEWTFTEESKKKMSDCAKIHANNRSGDVLEAQIERWKQLGASPDRIESNRQAQLGVPKSDEHKEHLKEAWIRRKASDDPRTTKGYKMTDDQKEHVADGAKRGWEKRREEGTDTLSDTHRANIQASWEKRRARNEHPLRGRTLSPETKQKMRLAAQLREQKKKNQ